ncbi:rRNA-processing protein [Yarrowia sp. B02]|nr:rRNA-processing protein [Yarrowia sp. B02]
MAHPTQRRYQNNKRRRGPREVGGAKTGDGLFRIKKRIRDLERVLNRPVPMDESKRIELERAVAAYKVEAEDLISGRKNKKNVEKYRMIRFFERQKASRKVKQARKLVENADSDAKKADAEALVTKYMADLAYTIHFPNDIKYISLYPNGAVDETAESSKQREKMRAEFAEKIKNGELDVDLDRAEQVATTKKSKKKREAGADEEVKAEEEDDEFLQPAKKAKKEEEEDDDEEEEEEEEEEEDSDDEDDDEDSSDDSSEPEEETKEEAELAVKKEEESESEEFVNESEAESDGKPESEEDSEDQDDESE